MRISAPLPAEATPQRYQGVPQKSGDGSTDAEYRPAGERLCQLVGNQLTVLEQMFERPESKLGVVRRETEWLQPRALLAEMPVRQVVADLAVGGPAL